MFLSSPIPVMLTNGFGTKKNLHWCRLFVLYFVNTLLQHTYIFPVTITTSGGPILESGAGVASASQVYKSTVLLLLNVGK